MSKSHKPGKDRVKKAGHKRRSRPKGMPQCCPCLFYAEPRAALEWLSKAFGLEPQLVLPGPEGGVMHAELRLGKGVFMLGGAGNQPGTRSPRDLPGVNQSLYVYVDDVDAHCERARAAGASIATEPQEMFWGDRLYAARDCEGHHWTFAQHVRDVDPAEIGAEG